MLKKALIGILVLLLLTVIGFVAFVYQGGSESKVLSYVPEKTAVFYGNQTPQNLNDIIERSEDIGYDAATLRKLADAMKQSLAEPKTDEQSIQNAKVDRLMAGYFEAMAKLFENKTFAKAFYVDYAFYEVEGLPVLRMALPPLVDIWPAVDEIETGLGIHGEMYAKFGGYYREYSGDESKGYSLIVAEIDDQLIVTMNTPLDDTKDLSLALGLTKPDVSIETSDRLTQLMESHSFLPYNLMDVDVVAVTDMFTQKSNSLLMTELTKTHNAGEPAISKVCQNDYHEMAKNWPKAIAGYTQYDENAQQMLMKVLSGNGNALPSQIEKLRGYISPNYTDKTAMFGMALGLNIEQLSPVLTDLWNNAEQKDYQCEALAGAGAQLAQANPMMIGMMTAMVQSLQGISIRLDSVPEVTQFDNPQAALMQSLGGIEATIVISAENPQILAPLAQFSPDVQTLLDSTAGETVAISALPDVSTFAAIKGKDIVLSLGNGAEKQVNTSKTIDQFEANGLLRFDVDMGAYFDLIVNMMKNTPNESGELVITEADLESFELMKQLTKFQYTGTFDAETDAFVFGMEIKPHK